MTNEVGRGNTPAARDKDGLWLKGGASPNPSGRSPGFASYIRTLSLDGEKLVDKVWQILLHPKGKGIAAQKLQLECIQWLADRGFGKAVQNVEHSGTIAHAWDAFKDISTEDLQALVDAGRAIQEAKARAIEGEGRVLETDEEVSSSQ